MGNWGVWMGEGERTYQYRHDCPCPIETSSVVFSVGHG